MTETKNKRRKDEARERLAATRVAQQKAARAKRIRTYTGAIVGVVVVVVAIVVVGVLATHKHNTPSAAALNSATPVAAPASLVREVTGVPESVLAQVGIGAASAPKVISAPPLTINGHPGVVYVGAEYCPYCAAERWAMVNALSRFGTFTGLETTHSSSTDVNPSTPTFTFVHASYTSRYLSFSPDELVGPVNNNTILQHPNQVQASTFNKYDSGGAFPFVDVGNKYVIVGASYLSAEMSNLTPQQVAGDLSDPATAEAKGILGTANMLSAAICNIDGGQPASVCTSASVRAGQKLLGAG